MELKTWLDSLTSLTGSYESNMKILDNIEKQFGSPKRRTTDKPGGVVDFNALPK